MAFQSILDSALTPAPGEENLAALTAGERTAWALARKKYFSAGVNKTSLHAIERSAFVVVLDQEEFDYDPVRFIPPMVIRFLTLRSTVFVHHFYMATDRHLFLRLIA